MNRFSFTTSWDDGHPSDLRIADILQRHGFKGTFYVPCRNREGRPVLSAADLRDLSRSFEIGAHTRDHIYLDTVSADEARRQIVSGKEGLEDSLGRAVAGFAYPGGRHDARLRRCVADSGFRYARTTENFRADAGQDRFTLPTTLQLYPHGRQIYLRNFVRYRCFRKRFDLFVPIMSSESLPLRLGTALDVAQRTGGVFHLWGHGWELERIDGWRVLDEFLSYAATRTSPDDRLTNAELAARIEDQS